MPKLICCSCGRLFDEDELYCWTERHGLDPSEGPGETWAGSPCCHDAFDDAYQCDSCGEWYPAGALCDGFCDKCLEMIESEEPLFCD